MELIINDILADIWRCNFGEDRIARYACRISVYMAKGIF